MAGGRAPDLARDVAGGGAPGARRPVLTRERVLQAVGIAVVLAVLLVVFRMYLHPDMILEFSNLVFCG